MSPETGCFESPRFRWGTSVIVMEFLDGLGGEVVEVLVRALGVEPRHPFRGGDFDLVDVAPRSLPADEFVLERPDGGLSQRVIQRRQLRLIRSVISELFG